jgi:hypothetical protein
MKRGVDTIIEMENQRGICAWHVVKSDCICKRKERVRTKVKSIVYLDKVAHLKVRKWSGLEVPCCGKPANNSLSTNLKVMEDNGPSFERPGVFVR